MTCCTSHILSPVPKADYELLLSASEGVVDVFSCFILYFVQKLLLITTESAVISGGKSSYLTFYVFLLQDFDQLLDAMKSALAEDSHTAFVFNCHSGRGRTTTAMVIAVLTLWHFNVGTCSGMGLSVDGRLETEE